MSKVVHPYAHRLVILRGWKSRWIASKNYASNLAGDVLIRRFLDKKLRGMYVSTVDIERNNKSLKILVHTSRPGMIIGRSGEGSTKLKAELLKYLTKSKIVLPEEVKFDIIEVTNPDADAKIVACTIAEGLEKRLPYRRVLKQTIEKVMSARGVKGARIFIGGRLGGAEIARTEQMKRGSIPLQTFRADVDFAREKAHMTYGDIGIKVWIYRGEIFSDQVGSASGRNDKFNN